MICMRLRLQKKALRIRPRFLWREVGGTKSQIPPRRMELGSCPGLRSGIRRRIREEKDQSCKKCAAKDKSVKILERLPKMDENYYSYFDPFVIL